MTPAEHNQQIDRVIDGIITSIEQRVAGLTNTIDSTVADQPEGSDITALVSVALLPVLSSLQNLDTEIGNLLNGYAETIELEPNAITGSTLARAAANTIKSEVESAAREIVGAAVIGMIAGSARTRIRESIRALERSALRRITTAVTESTMTAHGAYGWILMRAAGVERFRYAGGIIATSRDFCVRHNNQEYTLKEIRKIWAGSWGGKRPGDPFVTRGGYRCRHYWLPVTGE